MPESGEGGVIRAAGAVIWRPGRDGTEVALVHRPRYDDWSYPKGKCRRGEHVLAAAVREVTEETGLRVVLGRPLTPSVYQVPAGTKQVSYWAAYCSESLRFVPNQEVDQVAWLPTETARHRLSHPGDVALLDELGSAPVATSPFILLRHAAAGRRVAAAASSAADLGRPLEPNGIVEAKLLASLLACYGRCRVVSSPAERCLATVRPYASAVGATVEIEPAFTVPPPAVPENGPATPVSASSVAEAETGPLPAGADALEVPDRQTLLRWAAERAASLAARGIPTVICAHRENLPVLIDAAAGEFGGTAPPGLPLGKGAFLVLQSAGGVLVSSERHEVNGLTALRAEP